MLGRLLALAGQEAARAERAQEEAAQLTFQPAINAHGPVTSRPPLRLSGPDPYLAHERGLAAQRKQKAAALAHQAEVPASMRLLSLCIQGKGKVLWTGAAPTGVLQMCNRSLHSLVHMQLPPVAA